VRVTHPAVWSEIPNGKSAASVEQALQGDRRSCTITGTPGQNALLTEEWTPLGLGCRRGVRRRLRVRLADRGGVRQRLTREKASGTASAHRVAGRTPMQTRTLRHRSSLKERVHAVLLTHGRPCPVSDLFGLRGRQLLANLARPEPWQGTIDASLRLIDELDREITGYERELRRLGADHRDVSLLLTVPGIGWVLAYTIAAELGNISRFPTPRKLAGYTGLCPRASTSPASATCVAARQAGTAIPAPGIGRGRHPRLHPPHLPRSLSANEDAHRQAARRPGRSGRPRPPALGSDLAHADARRTLRSQRRHRPPGRLTVLKELRHRSELPSALSSHQEAIERSAQPTTPNHNAHPDRAIHNPTS